jgi:hypothetical protein
MNQYPNVIDPKKAEIVKKQAPGQSDVAGQLWAA